ncbi:GNAT family N-acetyltransferase [Paraglaciecola sp. 2405UD69-4]|uniref:GNAT family N-acetyltransferase n=1 Tax=Paraglaciecola sp. 2405UD69-4 TaxID=3391836 RepID=UPI0039C8EB33
MRCNELSGFNLRIASKVDLLTLVEFNQLMAFETEQKTLDEALLTRGVAGLLEDKNKGFYLVAEQDGKVVASLMVTTEWSDWRNSTFWWIQSVYVVPKSRRKGLYSALYNQVKELAKDQSVCGFRLYVEKDNFVAQKTYRSLGMDESHYLMFEE